jgi:hypothetical protein
METSLFGQLKPQWNTFDFHAFATDESNATSDNVQATLFVRGMVALAS